ncbi:MAG TPA: aromatic ring-hydroxylating dioxygenase subunit alpha [Terriglobales bacterium]|nr:aromatic ring-hydroxylating dioxygenase subunit alpha [Terriglobales bacterium]
MSDENVSIAEEPRAEKRESEMLFGFWYPALRSTGVRGSRLAKAMLLGIPLVVGRDAEGRPFALRDVCPHRGMPLSYGRNDGATVECSYHGWRFDAHSGQCREIPSLTPDSKLKVERIFVGCFPAEERDGYIWVYIPEAGDRDPHPGRAPELPVFSRNYRITHLSAELPCGVDLGIMGLMDPAHGPFVHQSWWWRSRRSIHEKEKRFEPIPFGFRMAAHTPSKNSAPYRLLRMYGDSITTTIDFVLPNLRLEQIRCGTAWFSSRATVTPITADRCRIDFCAAWNVFPWMPFIVPIFRLFAKQFLRQDQQVMIQQSETAPYRPNLMLVDDADRQARWYLQLKAALQKSRATGEPMQHPMSGPVTLRWRS